MRMQWIVKVRLEALSDSRWSWRRTWSTERTPATNVPSAIARLAIFISILPAEKDERWFLEAQQEQNSDSVFGKSQKIQRRNRFSPSRSQFSFL